MVCHVHAHTRMHPHPVCITTYRNECTHSCIHAYIHACTTHHSSVLIHMHIGIVQVGKTKHQRTHTDNLRTGPSTRRGRYLSKRGRCVSCVAAAPLPSIGGRKTHTRDGKYIPTVCYACDVCRVHLCRHCFHNKYDHSARGKPLEKITLM